MDFKGVIKKVLPIKSGVSKNGNNWVSQDFVIEEVGQRYNQSIVFNVFGQDKIDQFQLAEGLVITAQLDFQTNEYQEKFYNRVTCFNVIHEGAKTTQQTQPANTGSQSTSQQAAPHKQYRNNKVNQMICLLIKPLV